MAVVLQVLAILLIGDLSHPLSYSLFLNLAHFKYKVINPCLSTRLLLLIRRFWLLYTMLKIWCWHTTPLEVSIGHLTMLRVPRGV